MALCAQLFLQRQSRSACTAAGQREPDGTAAVPQPAGARERALAPAARALAFAWPGAAEAPARARGPSGRAVRAWSSARLHVDGAPSATRLPELSCGLLMAVIVGGLPVKPRRTFTTPLSAWR